MLNQLRVCNWDLSVRMCEANLLCKDYYYQEKLNQGSKQDRGSSGKVNFEQLFPWYWDLSWASFRSVISTKTSIIVSKDHEDTNRRQCIICYTTSKIVFIYFNRSFARTPFTRTLALSEPEHSLVLFFILCQLE